MRVYRQRGEETVEACEESFNECKAAVGRLPMVPFEVVGVTAAKALQNFGEEFNTNSGTDVSPIIALYAETGVAAIKRGGQAAIDAINVFGNPAAFNFAKLGVAAEALVALGFVALKLAVVAYLAAPLAMVAVASALLDETFDSFGIRLPDELLELDKYTLEAFAAVFDFIEGDVARHVQRRGRRAR